MVLIQRLLMKWVIVVSASFVYVSCFCQLRQ
jgi:hypothetical protein